MSTKTGTIQKMKKRIIGKTEDGRVIITLYGEEPKSARRNKECYRLWKLAETLSLNEIEMLISKRRNEIKYCNNNGRVRELRTEILVLEDSYKIVRRRKIVEDL